MEQLSSHWMDFHEIWYWSLFENLSRKFKFPYNLTRITGTLHEDQSTFFILPHSVFLRARNVLNIKFKRKSKLIYYIQKSPPPKKKCRLWDNVEYMVDPERPQMTRWRMPIAYRITDYIHTFAICNTVFSTATMVAWMCLIVRLYIHLLSCFYEDFQEVYCITDAVRLRLSHPKTIVALDNQHTWRA
jgi:hypothetical protein